MTDPTPQLPTSYWTDTIRADLRSRREALCDHGAKCSACTDPKEIEDA